MKKTSAWNSRPTRQTPLACVHARKLTLPTYTNAQARDEAIAAAHKRAEEQQERLRAKTEEINVLMQSMKASARHTRITFSNDPSYVHHFRISFGKSKLRSWLHPMQAAAARKQCHIPMRILDEYNTTLVRRLVTQRSWRAIERLPTHPWRIPKTFSSRSEHRTHPTTTLGPRHSAPSVTITPVRCSRISVQSNRRCE